MTQADGFEAQVKKAQEWATGIVRQLPNPKTDIGAFELHLSAVLIMLWGAQWGTFGSEYARDFLQSQLNGVLQGVRSDAKETRQ